MNFQKIKKLLARLRYLPLHPQWFVFLHAKQHYRMIGAQATGVVLDIGCANQFIKDYLSTEHIYIGLDYYQTATQWYETRPQLYGNAQALPIANNSVDTVLLLDVLEHLPCPEKCLQEIQRVLKPGGQALIKVPFLYPLHDEPLDFQRWTQYGLQQLATQHGLVIKETTAWGEPLETAALFYNIALSKTLINWIKNKHPLLLVGILIPPLILLINLASYILSLFAIKDKMMPHSYKARLEKM